MPENHININLSGRNVKLINGWVRFHFRLSRHDAGYTEPENHLLGKKG